MYLGEEEWVSEKDTESWDFMAEWSVYRPLETLCFHVAHWNDLFALAMESDCCSSDSLCIAPLVCLWLRFIPATWVLTSLPISTLLNPKHTKRAPFLPPRCPLPAAWIQCSLPPHSARGRGSAHGRGNRTSWGGGGSLDFECSPLFLVWKYLGFV